MTQFRTAKYGDNSRRDKGYRIDKVLIPVVEAVARRKGLQPADVVNTGIYQLKEVQQELRRQGKSHEEDTRHTSEADGSTVAWEDI